MAINDLEKMNNYNPTNYVNNSEPDIDADNLNKTENKLAETVEKANQIIDALKTLISTVQTNSKTTVPSSSLAYSMQQEITKNKEDIATANSNLEKFSSDIQAGTKTGISAKGNSVVEYAITFEKEFSKLPEVVATLHSGTTNPNYGYLAPIVWDVTTTGFKIRIANAYTETFAPDVTWVAVAK
mgnify:CR=1 FL=1|jgi:hypothetical protein|nr:MAG TPA: Galactose-binding lectin-stranded antiparallel-beta sandwich, galactose binding [Caudoviricetes sp.]